MKIAIDCRYYNQTGIGTYLEGILEYILKTHNEIILIGDKDKLKHFKVDIIHTKHSPLSLKGLFLPRFRADVFFTPYFFIPYRLKMSIYSVIHDVVFLDLKYTNKNKFDLLLKKYFIRRSLKKSQKIFTVSKFSFDRIQSYYKTKKLVLAYPGVSKEVIEYDKIFDKEDFIVFVGNVKKNKGLKVLLEANDLLLKNNFNIKIKIVGEINKFRSKEKLNVRASNIEFTGFISDDKLLELISKAKYLVQPSLYEGFGSPPLEALHLNTKVILSDIPVFKEVYGAYEVIFFKAGDANSLKQKIIENWNNNSKIKKIPEYSYLKTSQIILDTIKN